MANTHDMGRLFWACLKLDARSPRYTIAPTYETSDDGAAGYRGSRSIVLRLGRQWGLVIGWWENNPHLFGLVRDTPEYERAASNHLIRALASAPGPPGYRADLTDEQVVRLAVGNLAPDPGVEWQVLCMMGLEQGDV